MVRLRDAGAALVAGGAAWLSQGRLGFATADGGRIGVLPYSLSALTLVAVAIVAVLVLTRRGASPTPLALLAFVVVPWLPLPLPAVFLLWVERATLLIWGATALAMIASLPREQWGRLSRSAPPWGTSAAKTAGAIALVVYAVAFWQVRSQVPGGDEPHYLVITQSLLTDRDLQIENNHRRGDYRVYFPGDLRPDYIQRGRNGQIYSIHAPGISAVVAPVFAVGGYYGTVAFLIIVAALGSALAWRLAFDLTGRTDAAWFGWAAATLSATAIFQSFTVYPDGVGGVITLTGVWALLRAEREREVETHLWPWLLHGAALALLPWLHTRFAALAGTLGALILLRLSTTRNAVGKAVSFLIVPAVSALAWIGYFVAIYGRADPSAPYGSAAARDFSLSFVPSGAMGILFDQRFGVLAYTPALAFAFIGLAMMLRRQPFRRLSLELLFVLTPYFFAVTYYAMWWGGRSAPARFLTPIVPLLALPAAVAWSSLRDRAAKATALAALAFSFVAAGCLIFIRDGMHAFNGREGYAQWLEWLNPAVELVHGVPVWFRGGDGPYFRDVAIWIVVLLAAFLVVRYLAAHPRGRSRGTLAAITAGGYAIAAMIAVTIVWMFNGSEGIAATNAQFALLRRIAHEPKLVGVRLDSPARLRPSEMPALIRIEAAMASTPGGGGGPRMDRPLFQLPGLPAGRYRLKVRAHGGGGWLMAGVNERDPFALITEELAAPPQPLELEFPVDVRSLVIRGDEDARRSVRGLIVEPLSIVPNDRRLTDVHARRAVRYGASLAFFLDDGLFAEPEAFWVGGSRSGTVVVQPGAPRTAMTLFLRNAPVDNELVIETGGWSDRVKLSAGEERRVEVPMDPARGATMVTLSSSSGFRPSATDPTSRDDRFLGVWVKVQ